MLKKIDNSIRKTIASSVEKAKPHMNSNVCIRVAYIIFALIIISIVVIVYILVIAPRMNSSNNSNSNNNLFPTLSPTAMKVPVITQIGFYHTSGNQMVDVYGKPARISSVNWNGFETASFVAEGLTYRNYKFLLNDVRSIGFNTIRIPFSNQLFLKSSSTSNIDYDLNKDFFALSPLECLDEIIKYCGTIGLRVILTRSSALASNAANENFWYIPNDPYYTEHQFISDWMMLAIRYKASAVLGADLWDQPKSASTWGTGNIATDWNQAVTKAGNAILAVNPQWLIFVSGVNSGTDLRGVMSQPIKFKVVNKIIYTAHVVPSMTMSSTGSMAVKSVSTRTEWNQLFGFIVTNQVAPVCVVTDGSGDWLSSVINYVNGFYTKDSSTNLPPGHTGMEISYSALNPDVPSGGIFKSDWQTPSVSKIAYVLTTFSPALFPPFVPNSDPSKTIGNSTSLVPNPTLFPTTPSQLHVKFGYLHTSGNQIVDSYGQAWRITGINWDGFESANNIVGGLTSRNYQAIINQIKNLGFNCIRLSYSNQMLISSILPSAIDYFSNPDLVGLSPIQCLDKIILYCGTIGLRVILVRVSSMSGNANNEVSWYIPGHPYYTEKQYINDWTMLALRYKGTAVIGGDLWNEPKTGVTWGTGLSTDWDSAVERVGNAILKVNPQWIIFVQGLSLGRDLTCVNTRHIKFSVRNKLVYAANLYSNDATSLSLATDPTFPYNIRNALNINFGYIVYNQIAPLYISALGTSLTKSSDYDWMTKTLVYLNGVGDYLFDDDSSLLPVGHVGISWSYASLNPLGYVSGILSTDWFTPYSGKLTLIKSSLAPLLAIPYVPNADPSRSINNVTSIISSPTLKPTARISDTPTMYPTITKKPSNKPTAVPFSQPSLKPLKPTPTFGYFHTSGNQMVDALGKNWRISGIIWGGFETTTYIPQGLWSRNYTSLLNQVKQLGFNTLYIPFSNQMFVKASKTSGIDFYGNPDLVDLSPLECLDYIVNYCGFIGLKVILLRYSSKAGNFFDENTWYIPGDSYYTEQQIIEDWTMLATRYRGSAVIGADLWNQPRGNITWGTGIITDWDKAATRAGNAILRANPQWLIFIQGISWGTDVSHVVDYPVVLNVKNKIVYSVQQYADDAHDNPLFDDPTFPANLRTFWNQHFGIIDRQQIAPILVIFGTSLLENNDDVWMNNILNYLNGRYFNDSINSLYPGHLGMNWIYFQLNPYGPTGGILQTDWSTVETQKLAKIKISMAPLLVPAYVANSDPSKAVGNITSIVPFPSISPTMQPKFGYFHTSGNQIVDSYGKSWRITGLNWYGIEGIDDVIQGLWIRNYKSIIDQVKDLGFNSFRIPFSSEMLINTTKVHGVWYGMNPDLKGLSPLECMDKIIEYCGIVGIRVILDRHSSLSDEFQKESFWYIPGHHYYTEQRFLLDWEFVAKRYKGTTVIGADLWNEPKMHSTWGTGNVSTDWNLVAEKAGNVVLDVCPEWLIFVEGVGGATWWGGDLRGVRTHPIRLKYPNKLVYSTHEYCQDVKDQSWFADAWFPQNLRSHWDNYFGFIYREQIAPVWVGEFGTRFAWPFDKPWLEIWVKYMDGEFTVDGVNELLPGREGLSWSFWALNPGGDTGGLLEADWLTIDQYKFSFIKNSLAPMLLPPIVPNASPFYSIDNVTSLIPIPTLQPSSTVSPTTTPKFFYYSTFENQIVDHNWIPARLHSINWYGFDTSSCIPHGLWSQKYTAMIQIMQRVGFNTIRIPFASEMLRVTNVTIKSVNYKQNPQFHGRTPLQVLDLIIEQAGLVGMNIILDRHSILFDGIYTEHFWSIPGNSNYTEDDFILDWVMLATRYKGTAVIGAELWTQPRGNATWGTGLSTDWDLMAQKVGNAIHAVNPDWLIFVQGISTNETWAGGDLRNVRNYPVALNIPNKLVYSVREYGPDMMTQPWFKSATFPYNLRSRWNKYFGYIMIEKIAPVFIAEFGSALSTQDKLWLKTFMGYMNGAYSTNTTSDLTVGQMGMSFAYWSVSPFGPVGGIFQSDFWAIDYKRLDKLNPILLPFQNNSRPTRRLSLH